VHWHRSAGLCVEVRGMKTDDLIRRLARDGAAVTPLPAPPIRAVMWLLAATVYLAVVAPVMSMMMGAGTPQWSALFVAQQGAALLTGGLAAYAALGSVVPGYPSTWRTPLLASAAIWLMLLSIGVGRELKVTGSSGAGAETDWPCVALMTFGGALLVAPLVRMLQRGAPFTPRSTLLLAGVGALSVASIAACLARPHAYTATIIIWHGATLALLTLGLAWTGCGFLRSRPWASDEPETT
jgi:hypothetical protein